MRSRGMALAMGLSVLCAGVAVGGYLRARALRTEAGWLLERGSAEGQEYADTFDGQAADTQLSTLEQRHAVLERAHVWQAVQMLAVLASVVFAFSSYVLFLFRRLRDQLLEVTADAELPPEVEKHEPDAKAAPVA